MFLVDKYYNDPVYINYHKKIIDKIINSFDTHNQIYNKHITSSLRISNDFRHLD